MLRLLAAGCTDAQIGAELYISPGTASVHVSSILRKLGFPAGCRPGSRSVSRRSDAVSWALLVVPGPSCPMR